MNKFHWLIIIISIMVIFGCAYFKTVKEGLTNNDNIVLIGDSILNNSAYVPAGKSVTDCLKENTNKVFNFAKDAATIRDCYAQLDQVPLNLNTTNTYIFISAGGNDILNRHGYLDNAAINQLFNSYMEFIKALRVKFGSAKINICNLFMPSNPFYQSYQPSIDAWNKLIDEYSYKVGAMYTVVNLHGLLNSPDDFIYDVEPSQYASEKIANIIYLTR